MPDWLSEFIFRRSILSDLLERSGQKRPSFWLQIWYGLWVASPYLVVCLVVLVAAFAAWLRLRSDACVYLGGFGVALIGLMYGLCANPLQGGMPAVSRFVERSKKNNVSCAIIVGNIPRVIGEVERQVSVLNSMHMITSIILFVAGLLIGSVPFVF